jgi:tetratricopeptide (TPR) repeat protein
MLVGRLSGVPGLASNLSSKTSPTISHKESGSLRFRHIRRKTFIEADRMLNSTKTSPVKLMLVLFLLGLTTPGCSAVLGRQSQALNSSAAAGQPPNVGLRILKVYAGGFAQNAGLQPMDLLSRYGDFQIVDHASYFAARDACEKTPKQDVQIEVWRGRERMTATVLPGRLGMETNEYNRVSYSFHSLMDRVNALAQIPRYQRDVEFKEAFANSPDKTLAEAREIIDRAEQEGTLTPTQILVARIYLISDDALPADLKKQSELVAQLLSSQPDSFIEYVGSDQFFEKKRYRPAIECFKKHLQVDPSNISMRLNLGFACYHVGMFDEAEAAADYVLDNKLGLSGHGFLVAYQVKAMATLGHHDYSQAISFAEKSFEINRQTFDISLVMFAAAQIGDLEKLEEAARKFQEALPEKYEKIRFQVEAVEALALVKNNQRDHARQLILKWKGTDRIEGKLSAYWGIYPGGSDIVKNWKELVPD